MIQRTSVSKIIRALFGDEWMSSFGYKSGKYYHEKFGFDNKEIFQRYFNLSRIGFEGYLLIRGCPDRISIHNGILYVEELKTTISNKDYLIRLIGETQLMLYMYITGIEDGILNIFYKDTKVMRRVYYRYDDFKLEQIIYAYIMKKYNIAKVRR